MVAYRIEKQSPGGAQVSTVFSDLSEAQVAFATETVLGRFTRVDLRKGEMVEGVFVPGDVIDTKSS